MNAIAILPQGFELEGANELTALGATDVKALRRSVAFKADKACFYRLYLQARLPFRLLREVSRFSCFGPESLYKGVQSSMDWEAWLHPSMSFRVDVSGSCKDLPHSHFTALQVKNALIDLQRTIWGRRSDINLNSPDFCLHLHLTSRGAVLSLDGSGTSLHRRGYRSAMGVAPLKENLAAGLIRMTGWERGVPLVDPLCGSGTFLIEAASIALGKAPGLNRDFILQGWPDFDETLWAEEVENAKSNQFQGNGLSPLIGCEEDPVIAEQARANVAAAGLEKVIHIQNSHFDQLDLPQEKGFLVCNPPYGKRIGLASELSDLYSQIGSFAKKKASGWDFWLLSGNAELTSFLRMKSIKHFSISNGGIECRWLRYPIR